MEDSVPLTQLAKERAIPLRTLSRWVKHYRGKGLSGLTQKARADKGRQRGMVPFFVVIWLPNLTIFARRTRNSCPDSDSKLVPDIIDNYICTQIERILQINDIRLVTKKWLKQRESS